MAQFKDVLPAQQGWIHELARAETHPDAERMLQLGRSFDPQQLVEESTIDFLSELRDRFQECARLFNAYSEGNTKFSEIKIYGLAQTAADFMVFRNQIKLTFSNTAHGMIQISFSQHTSSQLAVDGMAQSVEAPVSSMAPQELMAQVGPFRDVFWTFQGERVVPEQIARFYFVEYVRLTRDSRRLKSGNQVLLDQIKALLQEKGLDL